MEEREKKRPWVFLLAEGHPAECWLQARLDPLPWLDSHTHTHTHLGCLPSGPDLSQLLTHTWLKAYSPPTSCFTHTHRHPQTHLTARELPVRPETTLIMSAPPPPTGTVSAGCDEKAKLCVWAGWSESERLQRWGIMGYVGPCVCDCMGRNSANMATCQCILARWAWVRHGIAWQ